MATLHWSRSIPKRIVYLMPLYSIEASCAQCENRATVISAFGFTSADFDVIRLAHDDFLCIGCLEKRLGRKLTPDDFTNAPINRPDHWHSDRLADRLGHGRTSTMSDEKTLEEKLEEANVAVEKAAAARDEAIYDLMEAEIAYSKAIEAWGKLHDKSQAEARALVRKLH
jgi:hypothetical protein